MLFEGLRLADGRYCLTALLKKGGMGEIYLAKDDRIERNVAIKIVRVETTSFADEGSAMKARRHFQRELKAISQLDHKHILPLYDSGEEEYHGMTLIYLVMPYRPDGSLADWLYRRKSSPLEPPQVVHLIHQAAEALQHAHDHHIIHQDVKPANFLIQVEDRPAERLHLLLSDFGIARFANATASSSLAIRGTPLYMAPEQWEDRPTYATDQYALAIMAYELLVGHPPFQGRPEVVMLHHLQKLPAAPSSQNTTLTPALDAVLLRALAKRPEDRFPSVSAFADALCEAVKTMTTSSAGAIAEHVTLAISDSEALHGTRRTLEIGGEAVDVVIPPHVQHGQVIHLVGERRASAGQQTALPLQLKLEVLTDTPTVQAPEASSPTLNAAPTVLALPEKEILIQEKTIATPEPVSSTAHGKQTLSPPASDGKSRPARPRTRTSTMVFRVITLALLLLMLTGGSGWLLYQSGRLHSLDTSQHGHQNATATAQARLSSNATATAQAQLSSNATATAIASLPQLSIDKEKLAASAGNSSDDCSYSSSALVLNDHTYAGWSCPLTLSNSGSQNLNWSSQTASAVGSRSSGESGWLNIWSGSLDAGDVAVFPTNGTIQPNGTQSVTVIVIDSSDGTSCPATGYDITFSGPANEISVEWGCS